MKKWSSNTYSKGVPYWHGGVAQDNDFLISAFFIWSFFGLSSDVKWS